MNAHAPGLHGPGATFFIRRMFSHHRYIVKHLSFCGDGRLPILLRLGRPPFCSREIFIVDSALILDMHRGRDSSP